MVSYRDCDCFSFNHHGRRFYVVKTCRRCCSNSGGLIVSIVRYRWVYRIFKFRVVFKAWFQRVYVEISENQIKNWTMPSQLFLKTLYFVTTRSKETKKFLWLVTRDKNKKFLWLGHKRQKQKVLVTRSQEIFVLNYLWLGHSHLILVKLFISTHVCDFLKLQIYVAIPCLLSSCGAYINGWQMSQLALHQRFFDCFKKQSRRDQPVSWTSKINRSCFVTAWLVGDSFVELPTNISKTDWYLQTIWLGRMPDSV